MAADKIKYCLENLTDYNQFEILCCALLANRDLYPLIDPMGGNGDDGRDAIIRDNGKGETIAFAFTVRKDWLKKLKSDSERLNDTQKKLNKLVFVCTSELTARDKDKAFDYISKTYNWVFDLFDQARLHVLLLQAGSSFLENHPSIFTPCFFKQLPSTQINFVQQYLNQYADLFQEIGSSTEHLAVEIDCEVYSWLGFLVQNAPSMELTCYDKTTLNALVPLHQALDKVYKVISDEHYVKTHPNSWRVKFNNLGRSDINVQAVLAAKKIELLPYLDEFRHALNNFVELSRY
jgi:hypothetical protein